MCRRLTTTALLLVTVLALAACTADRADPSPLSAVAQADEVTMTGHGVTVEATGTVEGTPDVLTALVGVEVEAADVDTAYREGNTAAAAVRDALLDAGVAAEDVQTAQLSLGPQRHRGPGEVDGYVARTQLRVELRDLEAAGGVLDSAVDAADGHAVLWSLGFSLDDDDALLVEAREAAFDEARAKAEQYAELAGRSLGELEGLAEADHPHAPFPRPAGRMALEAEAMDAAEAAPPVEPGQEEVQVRIHATWALN